MTQIKERYLLILPDEYGNPITWLESNEVENIKQLKEDYGIKEFLTEIPEDPDPNYWDEGQAMLLEVEIKKVVPVKVVTKYELK